MNLMKEKNKSHFKKNETGYHKHAVIELASWLNGEIEKPFYVDDKIVFVTDVTCYKNGIIDSIYEVVYSHPLNGKKLGMIQEWCYRNATEISVFEISADYILKQTERPERIETMECYLVEVL